MRDDTYSLALLPSSMRSMSITEANAIEANLRYLISLFPYFSGVIKTQSIGSYGFLELAEVGTAGDAFSINQAIRIDRLKVAVSGTDLSALAYQGAGWSVESRTKSELLLTYDSDAFLTAAQIQATLYALQFTAFSDLDSSITLTAGNTTEGDFMPLGPVSMLFRNGTTWLLVKGKELTWDAVETANMAWNDFENLKKE